MTLHAISRAEQRYNLKLTFKDFNNIIRLIQNGESLPGDRANGSCVFHIVEYNKIPIKVLYNHKAKKIITVYPFDIDMANQFYDYKINKPKAKKFSMILHAIELLEKEGYIVLIK